MKDIWLFLAEFFLCACAIAAIGLSICLLLILGMVWAALFPPMLFWFIVLAMAIAVAIHSHPNWEKEEK